MTKAENSQKKKTTKSVKKAPVKNTKNNSVKKPNTNKSNKKVETKVEVKEVATKKVDKTEDKINVTKVNKQPEKVGTLDKLKKTLNYNWEEKREFSIACIIIVILIVVIIILSLSKQIPKLKNGEEVIASIDGLKVTSDDLYLDLKENYGDAQLVSIIDNYIAKDYVEELTEENEEYIDQVVEYYKQYAEYYGVSFEEFLSQYVGISGITSEDDFRDYVTDDYRKTLAVQKYIGEGISEDELKEEFEENYKEKLTVRHILIEVSDDVTEEDAKAKAEDLIKQLDEVKDDKDKLEEKFKDLAYDNSDDQGTFEDGGLFKNFSKSEVDENFWAAAKELKDGQYTAEAVKSQYGYHVILKISSKTNKYKDVKEDVKNNLAQQKLAEDTTLQTTAWDELRKEYNLKINDSDMKKSYKKSIEDAVEAASETTNSSDTESTTDSNTEE